MKPLIHILKMLFARHSDVYRDEYGLMNLSRTKKSDKMNARILFNDETGVVSVVIENKSFVFDSTSKAVNFCNDHGIKAHFIK